jgi:hypothetical protein
MRVSTRSLALAGSLSFLAALPLAAEDLTIVFKDGKGGTETQYYTATKMRNAGAKQDSIIDFASGAITMVDHQKKEYSTVTLDQMEAAMKQASAQMEAAMAKVPPEMRQKMEAMMGGAMGAITVTKGGTKKVAGYDTQQYTITMGQNMTRVVWNTTALQFPFDPAQFHRMSSFTSGLGGPMMKSATQLAEKMKEAGGFTLAETTSVKMMGQGSETSREAVEVKRGAISTDAFAIPAGYQKVDSPMLKMGQAGNRHQ